MNHDKLKGIICGIPHSGTTLLANSLTSGKEVFNKFEKGFLLKSELSGTAFLDPQNDIDRVCHGDFYLNSLKNIYNLTENEIFMCGNVKNWIESYNVMFELCKKKEKNFPYKYIIDKTPLYGRNLNKILPKIPGIPIILTYCDPRKFVASAVKRIGIDQLDYAISIWLEFAEIINYFSNNKSNIITLLCYENMISNPKKNFKKICISLNINYTNKMLQLKKSIDSTDIINKKIDRNKGIQHKKILEYKNILTKTQEQYILEKTKIFKNLFFNE